MQDINKENLPIKVIYTKQEQELKSHGILPQLRYVLRPSGDAGDCLLFSHYGLMGFLGDVLNKFGAQVITEIGSMKVTSAQDEKWPQYITQENEILEPDFPDNKRELPLIEVLNIMAKDLEDSKEKEEKD